MILGESDAANLATHADLVQRAVRWLRSTRRCRIVYAEIVTSMPIVPDAIGWGPMNRCEIVEAKVSRSDFRRDPNKSSHRCGLVPGRLRWYMTPAGLLDAAEVPDGWGLVEVHGTRCRVIVPAPAVPETLGAMRTEIAILASATRRHEIGVPFDPETARFSPAAGKGRA